jgi:hypothetical protein
MTSRTSWVAGCLAGGIVLSSPAISAAGSALPCDGSERIVTVSGSSVANEVYNVEPGEVVRVVFDRPNANTTGFLQIRASSGPPRLGPTCSGTSCTSLSVEAASGDTSISARITNARATLSCTKKASSGADAGVNAGTAAGGASNAAIGGAIGSATNNRFGGGGNVEISQNRLFFSSNGEDGGTVVAWGSFAARSFDGGVDGEGYDFTLGADIELNPTLILGAVLSFGDYDLTSGVTPVDIESVTVGAYIAQRVEDLIFDAYLTYAEPDYNVGGTRYSAKRWAGQAKISFDYTLGWADIRSFGSVNFLSEDHPAAGVLVARSVSSLTGSLGTKATYRTDGPITPYASLALEHNSFDNGVTTTTNTSPRVGAGFTYSVGNTSIQFDVDAGEPFEGTRDYGARVRLEKSF